MSNNENKTDIAKASDFLVFMLAFFVAYIFTDIRDKIKENINLGNKNTERIVKKVKINPLDIEKNNKIIQIVKTCADDIVSILKTDTNIFSHITKINFDVKDLKQIDLDLDIDINMGELWKWDDKKDKMFYYWSDGLEKVIANIKSKLYSNNIDIKKEKIAIKAYVNCYKYDLNCRLVKSDCSCWEYDPDTDFIFGCLDKPKIQSRSVTSCEYIKNQKY